MKALYRKPITLVLMLVALALVLAACPAPAAAPAAESGGDAAMVEMSPEQEAALEAYNLQTGKPFDGTELNFLICCPTAPQFANLAQRGNSELTELTGISATWGDVPFGEFQSKIIAEVTAGSAAFDLIAYVDAWGPSISQYMEPLDSYIEADGWDLENYPGAYLRAGETADGMRFGLPMRGHPFMFFYRADLFEEQGLEVPTTWEEVEAAAEVLKGAYPDIYPLSVYYGINAGQNLFWWEALLWGNGGDVLDENNRPIFNSPEGVEATERYISWIEKGYTSPGSVAFNEQEGNQEFNQGRAAMFVGWWWMYSRMTNCETNPAEVCENALFAKTPSWEGGTAASYGHIWNVGINAASENKEAAWEYMKFMLNEGTEKSVVIDDSDPSVNTNVAVRLSVLADEEVNEAHGGLQAVGAEILENARTQVLLPEWPEIMSILEVAINDMANGAEVQATLDQAAADVNDVMDRAGY